MPASRKTVTLTPGAVTLADLRAIHAGAAFSLDASAWPGVEAAAASVRRIVDSGHTVYGVNTGFGLLAQTRISTDKLETLQRNLILSHACGVGPALERPVVRLMIALKAVSLARGHSGVRPVVIERLIELSRRDCLPVIPAQGSVGASGDLAPLAHMACLLIGEGEASFEGERLSGAQALAGAGLEPLVLGPKEGLALINGTEASTALALDALFAAERVAGAALGAGAMSVEALMGSHAPFEARLHTVRGQPGQIKVAGRLRALLDGGEMKDAHAACDRVQDPYSFRCQPQVMGAVIDLLAQSARTLETEANGVKDNPVIFPDTDEAISGGNFHAEPVAFAADQITMALCEIGSISERRTAVLVDPKMSGLPAFLVEDGGVNSGFMIAQVTAAALVAENRSLAFPASVDSVPTSANQEDHVSMATGAARKAGQAARNAASIIAVELLCAAQGLDFRRPLKAGPRVEDLHARIRTHAAHLDEDRYMATDLQALSAAVLDGSLGEAAAFEL
ncbi:histidine ammonia-lyase [Alkalicaulis satelles]|uniref:Histidine ammonia-lyase n=1 Tax=Alkalicaulis satelles TaxID=2609175 RepID=A0A5M6ZI33_9PROT|nr:histidine ammonia-lyase [Alkalicaulis satelles]KAA5803357.1 histidine ammonia-lyase [Alkalicaulis satelles]